MRPFIRWKLFQTNLVLSALHGRNRPIIWLLLAILILISFTPASTTIRAVCFSFALVPGSAAPSSPPPIFRPCTFTPVLAPSSTPRDAIFTCVTKFGSGVDTLVRSLRTSGCLASVIIFASAHVVFPAEFISYGVTIVCDEPAGQRSARSPYKVRWEWYYSYLRSAPDRFDRIMHTDAFDAVCFGDPFALAVEPGKLYFQTEDIPIYRCPYNKNWLSKCHLDANKWRITRNTVTCSGSLMGDAQLFLRFMEQMVMHTEWVVCWGRGFDQGDFNYILYTSGVYRHNETVFMDCNSGFLTMQYCSKGGVRVDSNGVMLTPNGQRPVIFVHQYNRYKDAKKIVHRVCSDN